MTKPANWVFGAIFLMIMLVAIFDRGQTPTSSSKQVYSTATKVTPDWNVISNWPNQSAPSIDASPNPNQQITVIVLDDSGSMARDISAAKIAVLQSINAMKPKDKVAIIALNAGIILPFETVDSAAAPLENALRGVHAEGSTPLTPALMSALELLETEAATARSFGTYRLIITTDGAADDPEALRKLIENMARYTPIQITTIGIAVSNEHVLRRQDLASFVDVSNVAALEDALASAIAENTSFSAITTFE